MVCGNFVYHFDLFKITLCVLTNILQRGILHFYINSQVPIASLF
jgi:hypothetical protein